MVKMVPALLVCKSGLPPPDYNESFSPPASAQAGPRSLTMLLNLRSLPAYKQGEIIVQIHCDYFPPERQTASENRPPG